MSGLAASVASPTVPTAKGIESPDAEFVLALEDMGLAAPAERLKITRCSGGISCEVWLVEPAGRSSFVAKRPLAKLGVVADWAAPVERSRTEADWLKLVAAIDRALVPEVLAEDRVHNVFAMEYLPPAQYPVWKVQLAEGHIDSGFAGDVGGALAKIHSATAADPEIARHFEKTAQFFALRLEPYLLYTANRHTELAPQLKALAEAIAGSRIAVMQGDISPKNILCGPKGPVFLDAETACYGDPAFDLAFCLNHLLLKCVWHPEFEQAYLDCFLALSERYLASVTWEERALIEGRAALLLPALMLARIDGKSPVEYITAETQKKFVRRFAVSMLRSKPMLLPEVAFEWRRVPSL